VAQSLFCGKLWLAVTTAALVACGPEPNRVSEKPIPTSAASMMAASMSNSSATPLPPPTAKDVQDAVHRVFGNDVFLLNDENPRFVTGDFNGDRSPDLMVEVEAQPARLADINNELANWTIQSPRFVYVPPRNQRVVKLPPVPRPEQVRAGETLLAVIHGYGTAGWRDSRARQAYLLRQAIGSSPVVEQPSPSLVHDFGVFPSPRQVLAEELGGKPGVLYWTGATYAWHPEKKLN
jgi:hypothetical protein